MVNSERRITLMRAAIDPPGEARADWEIFAAAARRMGFDGFDWESAAEVYDEFAALTAGRPCDQAGVSHARLEREGTIQWPCRSDEDPGTARLYTDGRFHTATGQPVLTPALPGDPADPPDEAFPLILTTGRIASQWHTMTRTAKSAELVASEPEPFIALHPADARRAWIGERARVVSRRGAVTLKVRLDSTLREGTAFAPFHWGALHAPAGAGGVNDLTHRETDPVSRQPGLKATAIRVEPVQARRKRSKRVLIVGGGPAGVRDRRAAARARRLRDHARERGVRAPVRPRRAHRPPRRPPRGGPTCPCTTSAGTASTGSRAAARSSTPATASRRPQTGTIVATTRSSWPPARARSCRRSRASSGRSRSAPATTSARSAGAPTARGAPS